MYSEATHGRDIMEDPMLEEFAASLATSRIVARPSPERLLSPLVAPQEGEAPAVTAPS